MPCGKTLRIALLSPATVHWSMDGWITSVDTHTRDTGLGVHVADLPTDKIPVSHEIVFTFLWDQENRWEGVNYSVVTE
jgi:glucoamylase